MPLWPSRNCCGSHATGPLHTRVRVLTSIVALASWRFRGAAFEWLRNMCSHIRFRLSDVFAQHCRDFLPHSFKEGFIT